MNNKIITLLVLSFMIVSLLPDGIVVIIMTCLLQDSEKAQLLIDNIISKLNTNREKPKQFWLF